MTKRERVLKAIHHQETDIIPYQINFSAKALESVIAYTRNPQYAESIGNHMCRCYGDKYFEQTDKGADYWRDQFGVVWNRSGIDKDVGVVEEIIIKEPALKGYQLPEVNEERFNRQFKQALEKAEDRCVTANIGYMLFERAWSLRGMENLLMDMIAEPAFVEELFENICNYQLSVIDLALKFPVDGFYFGDDYGQQKGLIMGPHYWRKFIKPYAARIFEKVKRAGKFVALHSCGDIEEIFPDLIEIGLDVYQTVQPEIYDMEKIKSEYGKDLSFWGGISTQTLLPWATPDEVKRVTRDVIGIMRECGGYIASPTHTLPGDVPPQNIIALVEVLANQR
ncbi:MAG: uroporphyrinogen decarboxylase family protein [Bacillota bacterium]